MDVSPVDQSLTNKKTVPVAVTGVSDSEDDLHSEPGSPAGVIRVSCQTGMSPKTRNWTRIYLNKPTTGKL